jgi:multicomponent Na+:H+ antiporter subunit B
MRSVISLFLLFVIVWGVATVLDEIPFGTPKTKVGDTYIEKGREETGAANIVTSVVINYRGFDTLGEVTVLFVAAIGLGAVLATRRKKSKREIEPASLVLYTGCRFLFPLILLFGGYIFIHGHLTPGGGFQGGAIVASAFVLIYLGCRGRRVSETGSKTVESLGGLVFIIIGLVGLTVGGHYFLSNYLPKGELSTLFSAGVIPIIYIAIGFKVGSELAGVIDHLVEESE